MCRPMTEATKEVSRIWAVLPPVELRGVGGPDVESAMSYVLRVSDILGTTVWALLNAGCETGPPTRMVSHAAVCGQSPLFAERIAGLQRLGASEDLRCGTFWVLKDILALRGLGRSSERRRWCPECYRKWDASASYEPLIWSVSLACRCRWHGCDLVDECPSCAAPQRASTSIRTRHVCTRCKASLAVGAKYAYRTELEAWQESQCESLIALCATPRSEPISWESYLIMVEGLMMSGVTQRVLGWHRIIAGDKKFFAHKPLVKTLVSLAAVQGVSVAELLLDPVFASSPSIESVRPYNWVPPTRAMYEEKVLLALGCMRSVVSRQPAYTPPLDVLLRKFKVLRATIHEANPQLFEWYKRRYESQARGAARQHRRRAFLEALREIERKRTLPCWRGRSLSMVRRLEREGVERQVAVEVVREAFRFEAALRRLTGDNLEASMRKRRESRRGLLT